MWRHNTWHKCRECLKTILLRVFSLIPIYPPFFALKRQYLDEVGPDDSLAETPLLPLLLLLQDGDQGDGGRHHVLVLLLLVLDRVGCTGVFRMWLFWSGLLDRGLFWAGLSWIGLAWIRLVWRAIGGATTASPIMFSGSRLSGSGTFSTSRSSATL